MEALESCKGHFQRLLLLWLNEVHEMPEQTACSPSHLTAETVLPWRTCSHEMVPRAHTGCIAPCPIAHGVFSFGLVRKSHA